MREERDQERLDELRERLYARDTAPEKSERTPLREDTPEVPSSWSDIDASEATRTRPPEAAVETPSISESVMGTTRKKHSYRTKIIFTALAFFFASILLSSLFMIFGGNSISGENISISLSGPFTVGGGEDLPIQIGITNQNSVAIESATLIIEYPTGTQAADDSGRELFTERLPLENIRSGETINMPLRARVFGEENQELEVRASIEYRVAGSNATFFKEAEPLRFKVSSSPVSLEIDTVETLASGQETDITLTVRSNSAASLSNLLVKAEYPAGFDFTSSTPGPVSGQNTWYIDELEPEESATILIKGVLTGTKEEKRTMYFSVGLPNERDNTNLVSVFSTGSAEFTIEQPFVDVSLLVNNSSEDSPAIAPGEDASVSVKLTNTLDDTIYNGVVEMKLAGNALSDVDVRVSNGFYDSNTRTVVWDSSSSPRLGELAPGASETLRLTLTPSTEAMRTPQINIDVSVEAKRTREASVSGALVGSVRGSVRIASSVALSGSVDHEAGPNPPEVGSATTYEVSLKAEGSSNDVGSAVVTATLPSHATWVGLAEGDGDVSYNAGTRAVTWNIGAIDAGASVDATFQVSILPSVSQLDTTPTLVTEQNLRAEDRFTGTVIRASSSALTTGDRVEED